MKTHTIELQRLILALKGLGWKRDEIQTLLRSGRLNNLRCLLESESYLLSPPKTVDLSGSVEVPGLIVNWNQEQKLIVWNPDSFTLFQTEDQLNSRDVGGWNHVSFVRNNYNPTNACLLNYLLKYPYLIPKRWRYYFETGLELKARNISFLGTSYLNESRLTFVRGMRFDGKTWKECFWTLNQICRPDFFSVIPQNHMK